MTRFASRHPLVFSILAVLVAIVVIKLLDVGLADLGLSALGIRLIIEAAFCGYVIFLLGSLCWWREAGFKQPVTWRRLLAYLPLLLVPVLVAASSGFQAAPASQVIGFTILSLMVGFAEECLLRGVVLRALVPGGVLRAVLLSSLLFGLGHLVNIWQGASPFTTIVQVLYSFFLGIGFAGARLYTGTIWPAIVVHALIDFVDIASRGFVLAPPQSLAPGRAIVPIVITGLYALYGWWLLRRTPLVR